MTRLWLIVNRIARRVATYSAAKSLGPAPKPDPEQFLATIGALHRSGMTPAGAIKAAIEMYAMGQVGDGETNDCCGTRGNVHAEDCDSHPARDCAWPDEVPSWGARTRAVDAAAASINEALAGVLGDDAPNRRDEWGGVTVGPRDRWSDEHNRGAA